MPTSRPIPPQKPRKKRLKEREIALGMPFVLGLLVGAIPLLLALYRTEQINKKISKDLSEIHEGASRAAKDAARARQASEKCAADVQQLSAANNDILSRSGVLEMQIVDLTRERDDALRRASCRNRHIEAALPSLIASLVDAENNRTEACRRCTNPFQAPSP